jgi:hypothetical protein
LAHRLWGTEFSESEAQFSPDSRRIAYISEASGRNEVHVRGFPDDAGEDLSSPGVGHSPLGGGDGQHQFVRTTSVELQNVVQIRPFTWIDSERLMPISHRKWA